MTQEILACPTQSKLKGIIYPTTENGRITDRNFVDNFLQVEIYLALVANI